MTKLGLMKPLPQRGPANVGDTTKVVISVDTVREISPSAADTSATKTAIISPEKTNIPEDTIIIESKVWTVTLTNYGGGPISLRLREYKYHDGDQIEMLPDCKKATPEFNFMGGAFDANQLVYQSSLPRGKYSVGDVPFEVSYTYQNEKGGILTKKYRFYPDRYDYDLIIDISNRGSFGFEREYSMEWNNHLAPTELEVFTDYNAMWSMAFMGNERVKFNDYTNGKYDVSLSGNTGWIATRSKYFAAILMPRSGPAAGAKSSGIKEKELTQNGAIETRKITVGLVMNIPGSENAVDSFRVFVGPMDYELLKGYNNEVVDIIDIGTTPVVGWIVKIFAIPIMWLLPRMYKVIPNYGVVIILFSLFIKALTYPLSKKMTRSMMAMKELQPKMQELQKKHKNNPQALNKEMMKLYKEAGVNPFSGCLPYLPQLPLFIALYAVFSATILLRQAPFILWWDDLSRGALSLTDPYIIMVLLMVVLMFVQQKMTMTDPKNKMLIYIMPLMMGFFFYKASAGLVLYWTCFSLFSFLEQIIFKPRSSSTAVAEIK